jgi:hypothetical protein
LSVHALDAIIAAEVAMIAALDADDMKAIAAALPMLGSSVGDLKNSRSWQQTPANVDRLRHALALADSARIRLQYLADSNHRRMDLLAVAAGHIDFASAIAARAPRVA